MDLLDQSRAVIAAIRAQDWASLQVGHAMYLETERPDDFEWGLLLGPELDRMDVRLMVYLERNPDMKWLLPGRAEHHGGTG